MKLSSLKYFFLIPLLSFIPRDGYRQIENTSFGPGEFFEYKVHYGLFNAAEARVSVSPQIQTVNGRPCYKVEIAGKTVGAFDWVSRIRDNWQSWIDTSAIVPQKSYRNIQEDKYRKEETVIYNHAKDERNAARATVTDENGQKNYDIPNNAQDVISGYYFLRTIDFNKYSSGDVINIPAFFDREIYSMKIRYRGRETVKTKFGTIAAIKLNPVLSTNNQLFKGDNSIRIWVSDDANKVPVRVEVDLWVGSMVMEMRKYGGLRQDFKWQ